MYIFNALSSYIAVYFTIFATVYITLYELSKKERTHEGKSTFQT